MTTFHLRANSTARLCSTPEPALESSSMSS